MIGHADCPGLRDIKGYKAVGWEHDSGGGIDVKKRTCHKGPYDPTFKPSRGRYDDEVTCGAVLVRILLALWLNLTSHSAETVLGWMPFVWAEVTITAAST